MNWLQRLDVIVLALMLAYVVAVFVRVSYLYHLARRAEAIDADSRAFQRGRRKLVADLSIKVGTLNSIAVVAPYLGLAGTSIGIVAGLRGVGIVAESGLAAVIAAAVVPVALITTIVGLLVAIPAACSCNYLRTRMDLLQSEISSDVPKRRSRHLRFVQKFPLAARFSKIPFALIAAPSLAILVGVVFLEFSSYETPAGLDVELASARCEFDGDDRPIVLRVTKSGDVFINSEREDWSSLSGTLSRIYALGKRRVLYLLAEDNVPFQTVADAIDIIENAPLDDSDSLGIRVRLVTPAAMKALCLEPVAIRSARHVRR